MGYVNRTMIEQAGRYLLNLLQHSPAIRYSEHFYDATDETHQRLQDALGLEDDWYSPELLIDVAAEQLAAMGLVDITWLDEKMADGEADSLIRLTEKGKKHSASGKVPVLHGVDL